MMTWWANRPSCQNPKAKISSGCGAWAVGNCFFCKDHSMSRSRVGAARGATPGGGLGKDPETAGSTPQPRGSSRPACRSCGENQERGRKESLSLICRCGRDLPWACANTLPREPAGQPAMPEQSLWMLTEWCLARIRLTRSTGGM